MYILKISEQVNILMPSMTVHAMLLLICAIGHFEDLHIPGSRLKTWMSCSTGNLDLPLLFHFCFAIFTLFGDHIRFPEL